MMYSDTYIIFHYYIAAYKVCIIFVSQKYNVNNDDVPSNDDVYELMDEPDSIFEVKYFVFNA